MSYEFTGTNVWIYGTAEGWSPSGNPTYMVSCDPLGTAEGYETFGSQDNLLGGCRGMTNGTHLILLFVQGERNVQIWSVTTEAMVEGSG